MVSTHEVETLKRDKLEFAGLLILTADLFINVLPGIVYLLALVYFISKSSRVELAFIAIFFPGRMFMYVFDQFLYGNGALLVLLITGLILLYPYLKELGVEVFHKILPLILILLGFLITYTWAPKGYYSGYKTVTVIINGLAYFVFFVVFIRTRHFDNIRIAMFLMFLFVFFVKMEYAKGVMFPPDGPMDFGFIRRNVNDNFELGISFAGYHQFGALAMYAVIFMLAWVRRLKVFHLFFIILGFYYGFMSGARQMILGLLLIFIAYLFRYFRENRSFLLPTLLLTISLATITIGDINVPFISDFLLNRDVYQDALGRGDLYGHAIDLFIDKPVTGEGLGGYSGGEVRDYPHNIILEVLAEGGLFMFLLIFITLAVTKFRSQYRWWEPTENGSIFLFLILGFAIRALSSSDLIENIALISALTAIGVYAGLPEFSINTGLEEVPDTD